METQRIIPLLVLCVFFSLVGNAQKRSLTIEDMATWDRITNRSISPNGTWVCYEVDAEQGDPTSHFYNTNSVKTYSFPNASKAKVSHSERWAAFKISPPEEVVKSLKRTGVKEDKLPLDTLALLTFQEKNVVKIPGVQKFSLPDSLSNLIVYSSTSPYIEKDSTDSDPRKERSKKNGFDLIIRNMEEQSEDTIAYVVDWELSKYGHRLLAHSMPADSADVEKWISYDLATGRSFDIYDGKGEVKKHAWSHDGEMLALILDLDTTKAYIRNYDLHLAEYDKTFNEAHIVSTQNKPTDWIINPNYSPQFSKNGKYLFYKYAPHPLIRDTARLDEEMVDVEIWTTNDEYVYPMQNKRKDRNKENGQLVWYDVDNETIRTTNADVNANYSFPRHKDSDKLLTTSNKGYAKYITWKGHDYKKVTVSNLASGSEVIVSDSLHGDPRLSPKGDWVYWWSFPDTAWMGFHVKKEKTYRWTDNKTVPFYREDHDYPALPWNYGVMGFSEDEETVFIYDKYDIWEVPACRPNKKKRVTTGRFKYVRHRYISVDKENFHIPTKNPILVHAFSHATKKSQYGTLVIDEKLLTVPELEEYSYATRVLKAKNSDKILFTRESYQEFPDLRLASDLSMSDTKKITALNPRKEDFYWGNIELFEWNMNGEVRQGMLVKPDDFDPNKKYPLMVNFYEKSSDRLHSHRRPYLHRSTINYPFYASKGYVIFNPDVNYAVGDPGLSATETVLSGVETLVEQGFIDEDRMALQGHSWGGYQIAHILTRTNIFKCAESGAPVVNMTSAYGGIRWGSGMSRMFQYEKTQSRLGATLWEDQETYLRNSPLFYLDKVETPVLILHNDEDGAVPWYQGIEYYMGLRRLGKPAWMLNYRGEPHWPVKFQNRKDFQTRMSQFFDHYLLGEKMPRWMREGVPAENRGLDDALD